MVLHDSFTNIFIKCSRFFFQKTASSGKEDVISAVANNTWLTLVIRNISLVYDFLKYSDSGKKFIWIENIVSK